MPGEAARTETEHHAGKGGLRGGCTRGRKGRFVRTETEHHVGRGGQGRLQEGPQAPKPRGHVSRLGVGGPFVKNFWRTAAEFLERSRT